MQLLEDRDMGRETASAGRWALSRHLLVAAEVNSSPRPSRCAPSCSTRGPSSSTTSATGDPFPRRTSRIWIGASRWQPDLLELADNEFSAIRDQLRSTASTGRAPEDSATADPRIPTPVLATYLGNRFPDAGWSRTEHYAWISGLLLDLGIDSIDALDSRAGRCRHGCDQHRDGVPLPAGAVRRLDDVLLAVFATRYTGLDSSAHAESRVAGE